MSKNTSKNTRKNPRANSPNSVDFDLDKFLNSSEPTNKPTIPLFHLKI